MPDFLYMPLRSLLVLAAAAFLSFPRASAADAERVSWGHQQIIDRFFSEGVAAGDIDGDGHEDLVAGPFWYAGPDFHQRHRVEAGEPVDPHGYAPHFFSYTDDFNSDGHTDILQIGFPGKAAYWLENPGPGEAAWQRHEVLDRVDNESPTYADITGDGRAEIVCSRDGFFGYAAPDADDPTAPWTFHAISDQSAGGQFTHGLGVGDVDGDGRMDLLEKSGWWEQPDSLDGDPRWQKHPFEFSAAGGSQMFAHDFDGDGDQDIVTALQAHGYGVAWYEQIRDGDKIDFRRHLIVGAKPDESDYGVVFSQPHAVSIGDIDGDGLMDVVTGKRPWAHGPYGDAEPLAAPVIYWFRCQRDEDGHVRFVPHQISDDSGVGVDVLIADVNGDSLPDVVSANKRGLFVHRQQRQAIDAADVARHQPVPRDRAARPLPDDQRPTSGLEPSEAVKQFTAPEGFHVDLIAGEPDLHQPIAFCFDARGRLWVAEAHTYPTRAPEGEGKDSIVIFEDADGDGRFETHKTFADGLNLVSGLEVGFGGVWVGAAPYLMFIPDADGDDVPDSEPEILLDGFGHQDTHETLNSFTWGPDGWLYGCQGVFTHSQIGAPGSDEADRVPFNAGVWRFHPTRKKFEAFAQGTSNPWGVVFDQRGQSFITTCVIPHAFHAIQGGRYHRQAGQHFDPYTFQDIKTIADHAHYAGNISDHAWWGRDEPVHDDATSAAGGGHAHCGALIYQGDNWPTSYRGALMMHNLHGNRINVDRLRSNGSGFIASHGQDLLFANDPWYRGIGLQLGPDGTVYLIDWYDKNACHRTDSEIWDRTNGRLYRLRYGDHQPRPVDLEAADDAELVALHAHENEWHVRTARRLLMERSARGDSLDAVRQQLWEGVTAAAPAANRLRYLWSAHGVSPLTDSEILSLLDDADATIRAWTIQLACERGTPSDEVLEALARLSHHDASLVVRLYLASALQRLAADTDALAARWSIAEGLVTHADSQHDTNLPLMIWYGVSSLIPADTTGGFELAKKSQIPLIQRFIYRRAASDPALAGELVSAIAAESDPQRIAAMVGELAEAAPRLGKMEMPEDWPKVVEKLASSDDPKLLRTIQSLSVGFGDSSIFPLLRETVDDATADIALRREALTTLARGGDPGLEDLAVRLLDDPALRSAALPLLARFDSPQIPAAILERYSQWDAATQRTALDTLVSRSSHAAALLDAVADGRIARTNLSAVHAGKIRQLGDAELEDRLTELWGSVGNTPEEIQKEIERMRAEYTPEVLASADPVHGRLLYAKSCGQCHRLFGEGGEIGPDLTGANRGNLDYLLENILAPNALVGKDYQAVSVLTVDGRVVTGLVSEQTDAAIVLHDAEKVVTIPRSEIEEVADTVRSVMPEGILQPFSDSEVADLLAYLQSSSQTPLPANVPDIDPETGRVPGAIEGEAIDAAEASGGRAEAQRMEGFPNGRWSGNSQLWWRTADPGDVLRLPFTVDQQGTYSIAASMTRAPDYGIVRIEVDGTVLAPEMDLFHASGVVTTGPIALGSLELDAGVHTMTITITGSNPKATPNHMFGLDYIYVDQVDEADLAER